MQYYDINKKYFLWNVHLPNAMSLKTKECLSRLHIADRYRILMTLNYEGSRSSGVKVYSANQIKPMVSYLTFFESNILSFVVLKTFEVKLMWPGPRTVQGQPKSKIMVSIDTAWVISYSTYINPVIVSVTVFEIFDVQF